ncbi:hypothetical protein ABZ281_00245 [Streptomyces sp. NPDC006265]|uniref:hypothetical protein n=1 Tax=Streptomyces sp. NPDC006265 TaxID=3156740 RepID=UPI0033AEAEB6
MSHDDYPDGTLQGWANTPVSIPREVATTTRISCGARGLYVYLLTREDGAEMTPAAVAGELNESLPKVNGWWVELKSAGLITSAGGR